MASSSRGTPTPTQSLRPRTRRLISGLSDDEEQSFDSGRGSARIASPRGTPYSSRPVSPIPNKHPSRSAGTSLEGSSRDNGASSSLRTGEGSSSRAYSGALSGASLWGNSWSALQGLASNMLGTETAPSKDSMASGYGSRRRRRPFEATHNHRRVTTSAPPAQWGPSGRPTLEIGAGSKEQRDAEIRARKRRDLLSGGDNWDGGIDWSGRYKRRTSEDRSFVSGGDSAPARGAEDDGAEALVYVHKVKTHETLAGLAIRYNCQQGVLRKANRMWAHDSVQSRKVLVVPVDACGVKGKPVSGPLLSVETPEEEQEDLLQLGEPSPAAVNETGNPVVPNEVTNGWHSKSASASSLPVPGPPSSTASNTESELPWKHDSWVMLPNDSQPTEIGRLPRKTLGFFPPARRKSFCYSDGTNNTPSVSFDLPRPQASPLARSSFTNDSSEATSTLASLRATTNRPGRSSTNASMTSSNTNVSASNPPIWLQGPGGVGTLDRTTRKPGPAPDSLNRLLGPHLPNVQPPLGTTFNPPPSFPSILDDYDHSFKTGAYGSGFSSGTGGGGFAANLSGVEKWVRKTASNMQRTYSQFSDASVKHSSVGRNTNPGVAGLSAAAGVGDLIELTDAFEVGGEDDDATPTVGNGEAVENPWGLNKGKARANALPEVPASMNQRRVGGGKEGKDD